MNSDSAETPVETEEQAKLRRESEVEEEFRRQEGCGWAEAHADDFAGWGDGGDGDGE